jgi:hypothetical protein
MPRPEDEAQDAWVAISALRKKLWLLSVLCLVLALSLVAPFGGRTLLGSGSGAVKALEIPSHWSVEALAPADGCIPGAAAAVAAVIAVLLAVRPLWPPARMAAGVLASAVLSLAAVWISIQYVIAVQMTGWSLLEPLLVGEFVLAAALTLPFVGYQTAAWLRAAGPQRSIAAIATAASLNLGLFSYMLPWAVFYHPLSRGTPCLVLCASSAVAVIAVAVRLLLRLRRQGQGSDSG